MSTQLAFVIIAALICITIIVVYVIAYRDNKRFTELCNDKLYYQGKYNASLDAIKALLNLNQNGSDEFALRKLCDKLLEKR